VQHRFRAFEEKTIHNKGERLVFSAKVSPVISNNEEEKNGVGCKEHNRSQLARGGVNLWRGKNVELEAE